MLVRRPLSDGWQLHYGQFRTPPISDVDTFLALLSEHWGPHVQAVDAAKVAGPMHVELAAIQAWEAWRKGLSRVERLELEFLLRLACTDQVNEAIGRVGLSAGCIRVFMVVYREGGGDHVDRFADVGLEPEPATQRPPLKRLVELYRVDRRHLRVVQAILGARRAWDALPYCLAEMSSMVGL